MMPCYPDKDNLKALCMDGGMEKLKETEKDKESDAVDGVRRHIADVLVSQQKAADKHKFHSVGHQVLFCHTNLYNIIFHLELSLLITPVSLLTV